MVSVTCFYFVQSLAIFWQFLPKYISLHYLLDLNNFFQELAQLSTIILTYVQLGGNIFVIEVEKYILSNISAVFVRGRQTIIHVFEINCLPPVAGKAIQSETPCIMPFQFLSCINDYISTCNMLPTRCREVCSNCDMLYVMLLSVHVSKYYST